MGWNSNAGLGTLIPKNNSKRIGNVFCGSI